MPSPGSCVVCEHPAREAIDLLLAASASYRDIRSKYGASLRSLSEHRARGHHLEASDTSASAEDHSAEVEGPWVHGDVVSDLVRIIASSMPTAEQRVRLVDRVADRLEAAELSGLVKDALLCDLNDDEIADARRAHRGFVLLPKQTGDGWQPRWHHYAAGPAGPQLVEATPEQIRRAGVTPSPNETDRGTERAVRNTELEGAER